MPNTAASARYAPHDDHFYSSFCYEKIIDKLSGLAPKAVLVYYRAAVRPKLMAHVNSAFIDTTHQTWLHMCPIWIAFFRDT